MDAQELQRLYDEAGSITALARALNIPYATLRYRMERLGIPLKRAGYRSPHPPARKGAEHHNWKGGTYIAHGYVFEYAPEHPAAGSHKGYVHQHRLVMEQVLGRHLGPDEIVHHLNGDTQDNRPENLELHTLSTHMQLHKQDFPRDYRGRFTRE